MGYLVDPTSADLADAVRQVADGEAIVPPCMVRDLVAGIMAHSRRMASARRASSRLSGREREVWALLADGLDRNGIGTTLGLSVGTVRTYMQKLRTKFDVHSRAELRALWDDLAAPG